MAYYRALGSVPPKRHTQHRRPDGGLYFEELMGEEGFSSDSSLLYHRHLPSAIVDASVWELPDQALTSNHPLIPRHLRLHELAAGEEWKAADAVTGRRLVLGNADVRLSYAVAGAPSPLYRNGIGDECAYVEAGAGVVETVGVITGYGPDVDLPAAGYPVLAFVTLQIAQGGLDEIAAELDRVPEVLDAYGTTGSADVACRVAAGSHQHLQEVLIRINRIPAVVRSTSEVALSEVVAPRCLPLLESGQLPRPTRVPAYRTS